MCSQTYRFVVLGRSLVVVRLSLLCIKDSDISLMNVSSLLASSRNAQCEFISSFSFGSKVRRRFVPLRPTRVQLDNRRSFKIIFVSSHLIFSLYTRGLSLIGRAPCLLTLSLYYRLRSALCSHTRRHLSSLHYVRTSSRSSRAPSSAPTRRMGSLSRFRYDALPSLRLIF